MNTETELFMELLHKAREKRHIVDFLRLAYLAGYRLCLKQHLEDIKAGQNIQDYWRHQQSGAE